MYYLYKYPRVLKKLKDSLDKGGFSDIDILQDSFLKDMFEQCDYLNYVSKEGLRIDPPAFGSLFYYAKENIEIWGTPIDRGRIISINWMIAHYYSTEWYNPTEFLPERFDPESEYFFKPSKNLKEPRSLHSYNPFSVGIRNWVGQILAKLELKVILSRIITTLDFEIDEDQLKNNYAKFNLFSQMDLNGKVISKHVKNKAIYN